MGIEQEKKDILDSVINDIRDTYNMLVEYPSRDLIYKNLIIQNRKLKEQISKMNRDEVMVNFAINLAKSLDKDDYMFEETLSHQTLNIIDDIKDYLFVYEQIYGTTK